MSDETIEYISVSQYVDSVDDINELKTVAKILLIQNSHDLKKLEQENKQLRDALLYLFHWIDAGYNPKPETNLRDEMEVIRKQFNLDEVKE